MRRLLFFLLLPVLLQADERWIEIHSGPFFVLSSNDKAARETMNQLEQFRNALGTTLGKSDLHLIWPLRVIVFKKRSPVQESPIRLARDSYVTATVDDAGLSPERLKELARLLIGQNTARFPVEIENGLIELFSTLDIDGTRVTLGAPPPAAARSRDWARMHLLNVFPDYAGRSRVLFNNLEQTSDLNVSYQNAYQKSAGQIEKQLDEYMKTASYGTTGISGRPINPLRDFHAPTASANDVKIAVADLKQSYSDLHGPEAAEGLGLQALAAHHNDEAKQLFASAMQSESKSARVYYEAARLETDPATAWKWLQKSAELNPLWGEPVYREALLAKDLDRKAALLKKAASLDPRNIEYWETLAKNETEANRFVDAQKAWGGAERAAA
ncbi:MAG: hypothetical protein JO022_13910, partial [Acidobacteriaceae bacterium]|nr:hypothetical protein [Acidobacteriaceae bacterium]